LQLAAPQPRSSYTLQTVIEALAKRTPNETVYLLKSSLRELPTKELPRLVRHLLPAFSEEQQKSLKQALAEIQK
jgi:hypothetical protein